MKKLGVTFMALLLACSVVVNAKDKKSPVDYVNTLVGTMSKGSLSTGNTYPAIAMPWGMNFWMPQTGKMGDGWAYVYTADKIRGFKQTHQPSPWINDYGQFSLMPEVGELKWKENERASWFSHKAEVATPYYYKVYLADYDVTAEIAPTERAAIFRFTYPDADVARLIVDAFDHGSGVKIDVNSNTISGYTTRNTGGVADNFKNYFVVKIDRKVELWGVNRDDNPQVPSDDLVEGDHVMGMVGFPTKRGEQIEVRVASSFISEEQAFLNLQELGDDDFEAVKEKGRKRWNEVLGRIEVEDENIGESDVLDTLSSGNKERASRAELQRNAQNIIRFAMNTPAMDRLCGEKVTVEHIDCPFADDVVVTKVDSYYKVSADKETIIPADTDTATGADLTFGIDCDDPGKYAVTFTARSELDSLAQIPMTIYCSSIPFQVITWNGLEGHTGTKETEFRMFSRYNVFRIHFGGAGVRVLSVKLKLIVKVEDDPDLN